MDQRYVPIPVDIVTDRVRFDGTPEVEQRIARLKHQANDPHATEGLGDTDDDAVADLMFQLGYEGKR